jgi:anti-anti-sigma regulatory factor
MVTGTRKRTRRCRQRVPEMAAVSLPGDCTIREASVLHRMLLDALPLEAPVSIDGSAVERVDTSGLQMLLAFIRDRAAAGRRSVWAGHSNALTAAIQLSGLADPLGLADIEVV